MKCPYCGESVNDGFTFCPKCGNSLQTNAAPATGQGGAAAYTPPSGSGNTTLLVTISVCVTAVIIAMIVAAATMGIFDEEAVKTEAPVKETTETPAPAVTDEPAKVAEPAAEAEPASLNSMPSTQNVNPSRVRQVAMTGDFSDVACYHWLTPEDVALLSKSQLRVLRNTIYARHGRYFKSADLRKYFSQFSWYNPYRNEVNPGEFSSTEKHNIQLIQRYE